MSRTTLIVAGAGLVTAGAVAAALLTTDAAASITTHVLHFHAHATAQLATGASSFVLAEQDVTGSTVIGHDVLSCRSARTHSTCNLAFATRGGLIYTHFRLDDAAHTLRGTVSGGAGQYARAHGTIRGRTISPSDVSVALRYQV